MDPFYYEIIHTARGGAVADAIRGLIAADPLLSIASRPWTRPEVPPSATLFAGVVVISDDLAASPALARRVKALVERGFPVIPIVESLTTYDFKKAPLPVISTMNAIGLDTPDRIVEALLRHGGLARAGTGGQVFISYARADGKTLAEGLDAGLRAAGFRSFIDVREIAGGVAIQRAIHREIERTDLVILVDSKGAIASPWVAEEMDRARVAHVPVLAVTPTKGAFHHNLRTPHVPWEDGDSDVSVVEAAVIAARRLLARKQVFHERVARTLERVCRLRGWKLDEDLAHWMVHLRRGLRVECRDEVPSPEVVVTLCDVVGEDGRGMLVAGTRPFPVKTVRAFARLGGDQVCVTPLSRVACRIPERAGALTLAGRRVFLSAAMPDDDEVEIAAPNLAPFVITFIQTMVELGATVVFGGHPSVTPLVHRAIIEISAGGGRGVELHQAKMWIDDLPEEAKDEGVFRSIHWHGAGKDVAEELAALRSGMIAPGLDAAVFVGGKVKSFLGLKPGIVDEYERFRASCPEKQAFVLGMGAGAARSLLERGEPPDALVDPRVTRELAATMDPDLATALIVAEMMDQ